LGWGGVLALQNVGVTGTSAVGLSAIVVGLAGSAAARRQRMPALLYVAAGIIPLLPGLTIFEGMYAVSRGNTTTGLVTLIGAVSIGLALAAGAIFGEFIAQPVQREVRRFEARLAGPRLAGPLVRATRAAAQRPAARRQAARDAHDRRDRPSGPPPPSRD
jgi:uncharacterized membrane protein YjjB (DUF3815 family)